MVTLYGLVLALKTKGLHSTANWVSRGYYPGNANASVRDIMEYCECMGLNHSASLLSIFLEDNPQ